MKINFLARAFKLAFLLATFFSFSAKAMESKKPLRFAVSDTYDPPTFIEGASGKMSGISVDIAQHISKKLGLDYKIVIYPRTRMDKALLNDEIDLICISNPAWTKSPELYNWTESLYSYNDYIVRNNKAASINSINDLKGATVGVIRGYSYSKVSALFSTKAAERSNFFDSEGLFTRLELGQIQYGIFSGIFLEYMGVKVKDSVKATSNDPEPKKTVRSTGLVDGEYKIYCRTSKRSRIGLSELNKAIKGFRLKTYLKKQAE